MLKDVLNIFQATLILWIPIILHPWNCLDLWSLLENLIEDRVALMYNFILLIESLCELKSIESFLVILRRLADAHYHMKILTYKIFFQYFSQFTIPKGHML